MTPEWSIASSLVTGQTPRLDLAAIQESAREPLREALAAYRLPEAVKPLLTVGSGFIENDEGIVEIYVAAERPTDAVVLATALVDRYSGRVVVSVDDDAVRRVGGVAGPDRS
jgi:predicted nucleic acid-binding protein